MEKSLRQKAMRGKAEILKPCIYSVNGICQHGSCAYEKCSVQIVDDDNNNTMPCDGASYACKE